VKRHLEVALPLPLFRTFTYQVDGPLPPPGTRVLVPFRRGERVGWALGEGDPEGIQGIRSVLDILEPRPSVTPELLELARWMARYYAAPLGIVLRSMLPSVLSDHSRDFLRAVPVEGDGQAGPGSEGAPESGDVAAGKTHGLAGLLDPRLQELPGRARRVLAAVQDRGGPVRVGPLRKTLGMGSIWPEIRRLRSAGLVEHWTEPPAGPSVQTRRVVRLVEWLPDLKTREETFGRAHRQRECFQLLESSGGARPLSTLLKEDGFSRSVIGGLEEKGLVELEDEEVIRDPFRSREVDPPPRFRMTSAQEEAITALREGLDESRPAPFLLHGVTGSGKTQVYIQLLREAVEERGQGAIVLVPEISLTPQTVTRFRSWFGDRVAVLHSALSHGERYDQWRQIRAGDKPVVVGARSALFAPVPRLGVIVVDEEHDSSYKQSEAPRYQARDVAVVRARHAGAVCVLGSATPSLESWVNASTGKFQRLSLPHRVGGRPLPPVEVVDLRRFREEVKTEASSGILTPTLAAAIQARLDRGEQSILLLNRRGYSSFIQCRGCGEVQECPHCSVSLTFHRRRQRLLCHHCRHEEDVPQRCPGCGDPDLSYRGLGTEQVERVVAEHFPRARVARMDVDTTTGKWSHAAILERVGKGEVDILLGTQMIAKGLDFPGVTLVGVVNADVGLHLPDFRASERTFQLLSQVAGRAGRGERGGEVLIQTSLPGHYAVASAITHDYHGFAERELEERRSPSYPPGVRLVNVVVSSPDPELAAQGAEKASAWLRARISRLGSDAGVVGPAPAPIERLHGRWRWHFFLRGGRVGRVSQALQALLESAPLPAGDVRLIVDRDPVALL
jgi:primosomal protein N' (replication factor Y) (superfamily II helicase)